MLSFKIDLPDDAKRELESELNGLQQLLGREQITEAEALEWARQAGHDAAEQIEIMAEGPEG